jgi:hypothetical protein
MCISMLAAVVQYTLIDAVPVALLPNGRLEIPKLSTVHSMVKGKVIRVTGRGGP